MKVEVRIECPEDTIVTIMAAMRLSELRMLHRDTNRDSTISSEFRAALASAIARAEKAYEGSS
jgi:hypothetical protein